MPPSMQLAMVDDEVVEKIEAFNVSRLPEMISYKYSFMQENMFRFYRGTCHLFYEQLSKEKNLIKAPLAWICGDLHIENFGSYKGSNRLVYFDLNDFDEAVLAPVTWELIRTVTSILIAFETLKIEEDKALNMATLFLKSYSKTLQTGKANYLEPRTAKGIVNLFLTKVGARSQKEVLKKHTISGKSCLKIAKHTPKYFKITSQLKQELKHHITDWLTNNSDGPYNYKVIDSAFRLAGTGSVGLNRYIILLKSSNKYGKKFLLLDMKEAASSSLMSFIHTPQPEWNSEAERIVSIQKRMQHMSPVLLSACVFNGKSYIIQEMQPEKDSINFMLIRDRYRDIYQVIDDMATLTASSQLRSSGRQGSAIADELIEFGSKTDWQDALIDLAIKYAALNKHQYKVFYEAYISGQLMS